MFHLLLGLSSDPLLPGRCADRIAEQTLSLEPEPSAGGQEE